MVSQMRQAPAQQRSPPSSGHLSGWPAGVWCGSLLVEVVAVAGGVAAAVVPGAAPVAQVGTGDEPGARRVEGHEAEAVRDLVVEAAGDGVQNGVAGGARLVTGVLAVALPEAQEAGQAEAGFLVLRALAEELARGHRVPEGPGQLVVGELGCHVLEPAAGRPAEDVLQGLTPVDAEPGVADVGADLQGRRYQLGHLGAPGRGDVDVVGQLADGAGCRGHDGEQEVLHDHEAPPDGVAEEPVRSLGVDAHAQLAAAEQPDEAVDGVVHVALVHAQAVVHAQLRVLDAQAGDVALVGLDALLLVLGVQRGQRDGVLLGELGAQRGECGLGGLAVVLLGVLQDRVERLPEAGDEVLNGRRLVGDVRAVQQVLDHGRVAEERQVVDQVVEAGDERQGCLGVLGSLDADEPALVVEVALRRLLRSLAFGGAGFVAHE